MPRVASTPFEDYTVRIAPINWPAILSKGKSKKKLLAYMDRKVRELIDRLWAQNKEYHEQCEGARAWLDDFIDQLSADDPQRTRLGVILDIWGKFGIDPDFCDVHVEYIIS